MTNGKLMINCELNGIIYGRVYDIKGIDHVTCDGEYMSMLTKDGEYMYQLKFEDEDVIIIDKFDASGDEHLDSIGCHDFNDDLEII